MIQSHRESDGGEEGMEKGSEGGGNNTRKDNLDRISRGGGKKCICGKDSRVIDIRRFDRDKRVSGVA